MARTDWDMYRPLDLVSVAGAYVDADGNVLAVNPAFLEIWRRSVDTSSLEGRPLLQLFARDDRDTFESTLALPAALARRVRRAVRLSGSEVRMLAELAPIRRRVHDGIVWLVTLQPCHATNASGDQELPAHAGVFIDPRTPLEVVLGWTSLLQHDGGGPARVEYALGVIERNATREMHVIEDLLEVMRPSCTARPARRQPVNLGALVKSAVDDAQPLAATRRVHLSLTTGSEDLATTGNDVQLRCAVTNLIVNAVTPLPPGGAVVCGLWKSARWVGLVIGGTGEGTGAHGSQGLGMIVARQVAEMHGGVVTTTTPRIGHGAACTLILPRASLPGRPTKDVWVAGETAVSRISASVGPLAGR